jgi:hypothetical protein
VKKDKSRWYPQRMRRRKNEAAAGLGGAAASAGGSVSGYAYALAFSSPRPVTSAPWAPVLLRLRLLPGPDE